MKDLVVLQRAIAGRRKRQQTPYSSRQSIDEVGYAQLLIRTTRDAAALPRLMRETDPLLPIGSIIGAEELVRD